jgi:hypothetical protein
MLDTTPQVAGTLELLTKPYADFRLQARLFADQAFRQNERSLVEELPHFDQGIGGARMRALMGTYARHEMPVIETDDLLDLKVFLMNKGIEWKTGFIRPRDILPMQRQIYVDKAVAGTAKFGRAGTIDFLRTNPLVTDFDGRLFDGHHRWLTAYTIDGAMKLPLFEINEHIDNLLPDLLAFSDQRHQRNA